MSKYILHVDDDDDDRLFLEEEFLKQTNCTFLSFRGGSELLAFLAAHPRAQICLLVADMNMPQMSGMEILRAIRANPDLSDLPVIMFTTSSSPHDRNEAANLGARMFTKPTTLALLQAAVTQMLAFAGVDTLRP
ncbi:MAG: response regulator [Chitinophagaceae bacterium]|nr:MAG: response regulator [Chitinophagaceae bacterium]